MRKLAQITALTLVLQFLIVVEPLTLAQKPKAAPPRSKSQYAAQIALFEEFVKKQMALNTVGYQLGGAGMITEAIEVLNAAIRLYPQEANL
ncbi:MAG TPA: hypothetical protein VJ124_10445 [Pyrinomonadaceae bacterium]|nr:hypothetical protein [Pyrinomonadaceae bacterium]